MSAAPEMMELPAMIRASDRPIIVFEQAVRAIQACSTILEAKYWNDKAEALAAWAKIYEDDRIEREARALKLHAYRQIGRLAQQLRPGGYANGDGDGRGRKPGPTSLLTEHGIGEQKSSTILAISRMPEKRFEEVVNRPKPPSPSMLAQKELRPNPKWSEFSHRVAIFLSTARRTDLESLIASLDDKQVRSAKEMTKEAMDWLGELHELLWFRNKTETAA